MDGFENFYAQHNKSAEERQTPDDITHYEYKGTSQGTEKKPTCTLNTELRLLEGEGIRELNGGGDSIDGEWGDYFGTLVVNVMTIFENLGKSTFEIYTIMQANDN